MIDITYLFHDGFLVRTPDALLVFDFWKRQPKPDSDKIKDTSIPFSIPDDKELPVYVFVSHHHKDHFNKEIFRWAEEYPRIHYILSKDTAKMGRRYFNPDTIYKGFKADPSQVTVISPEETISLPGIKIKAFGSTDIGNSYLVELSGKRIFHAGDLNAWIWKDESTEKEVAEAIASFNAILEDIAKETDYVDYAMFPVDPRIGSDYFTGAKMFVDRIRTAHFFPMHFELWENQEERCRFRAGALDFKSYSNPEYGEYIGLTSPGDTFRNQT